MTQDDATRYRIRTATRADLPMVTALMQRAITLGQRGFLTPAQIEASRAVMGLDSQLVADGTFLVALEDDRIVGCGGWSRRATLFGGDHSADRNAGLLDPGRDAARIRAMYTDPGQTRRGIGRLILSAAETEASEAGFRRAELAATLSGEPLYRAAGYEVIARLTAPGGVPLLRMGKRLDTPDCGS